MAFYRCSTVSEPLIKQGEEDRAAEEAAGLERHSTRCIVSVGVVVDEAACGVSVDVPPILML